MSRAQDSHASPGAARTSGPETVVVHGSGVHVERAHFELPAPVPVPATAPR